eukprot:350420-Chlamydomonas_euryale.AAC.5
MSFCRSSSAKGRPQTELIPETSGRCETAGEAKLCPCAHDAARCCRQVWRTDTTNAFHTMEDLMTYFMALAVLKDSTILQQPIQVWDGVLITAVAVVEATALILLAASKSLVWTLRALCRPPQTCVECAPPCLTAAHPAPWVWTDAVHAALLTHTCDLPCLPAGGACGRQNFGLLSRAVAAPLPPPPRELGSTLV